MSELVHYQQWSIKLLLGSTPFPRQEEGQSSGQFFSTVVSWFCGSGTGTRLIWALTHSWLGMAVGCPQRT